MQVNNSQPSFGSTRILNAGKLSANNKYVKKINEYFMPPKYNEQGGDFFKPQTLADKIDFSKFNWTYHDDVLMFVGKDGGPGGADTFIGRILKQTFPNDPIEFVDDIAPVHVDGPVIDMTEIGKLFDK